MIQSVGVIREGWPLSDKNEFTGWIDGVVSKKISGQKRFLFHVLFASITLPPTKEEKHTAGRDRSHLRGEETELKEMISLSKIMQLVVGRAYLGSQGTQSPR